MEFTEKYVAKTVLLSEYESSSVGSDMNGHAPPETT